MNESISLHEFNGLPKYQKYALLEDFGCYMELYRREGEYKIALFELYGYYVEVWLNERSDKLLKAVAFDNYKKLYVYLQQIDITQIYAAL